MDPQIDPSAETGPQRSDIGTSASTLDDHSTPVADPIVIEPSHNSGRATTRVFDDGDNFALPSPIARAASIVIIAFQLGYTALDRVEYPVTFPRTVPLHIASVSLGLIALMTAMSPRPMRNWRAMALLVCVALIASTARIAVINGNSDVLIASIVLLLFAAGALLPWSPRFQATLGVSGVIAMSGYSMHAADLTSSLALDWTRIVAAMALAQLAAIHGARYRRKSVEQVSALAENQRLLIGEIALRAEAAAARERDHSQLQASEAMLRKVFEASPENIAINSLVDGRFIAVNDAYEVAGYTRDDVMGANIIALGMWRHDEQLAHFVEILRRDGHVKNMEVVQRCKNGTDDETHLISASATEVNGEPCVISMVRDITEIKRVETSLRASHAALRKIFDATLDIIVVTRLSDGAQIDFNQQFAQLGYVQPDLDNFHKGQLQLWANEVVHQEFRARIVAEGMVRNLEADFLKPDGSLMPAMLSAVRVELKGEDCVVAMIRDLTQTREASRQLEESEAALRAIFDVSPDAISVAAADDGRYVAVNAEFLRLGGRTLEQTLGKTDLDLGVWSKPSDRYRLGAALASEGEIRNMEIEFLSHDHTPIPTLISAAMLNFGHQPCVVAYIRDITARKRIERDLLSAREDLSRQVKALSESEETFRKLFDANLDSMTLGGVTGIYIDVNQEFVKTTGYSREEAVGHHFADLNMWIHPDEMIHFADQLTRTNEVRNLEVAFRMKDGSERPVLLSAINLELHGQLCCLTISRDIADIKMTQRELVAAREAAVAASRAKSEFLSSMSHEIRTPMNSILGMADLLMETPLGDEQRRYLDTVIRNGRALLALINSVLDLAKVESGRINLEAVEFDLKDSVEKVLETLAIRAHEKRLELMVRFAPGVPDLVLGDPLRLSQIMINLVGNAIKFTQHGQVLVSVEHDSGAAAVAGALKFTVTDTGIGIPADQRHLLFHAFSQADSSTSRKYGGSGLGLAIVSRLVALMHGTVEVASEPGIGSAFSFTAQFGLAANGAIHPAPSEYALGGLRILLVNANDDCRSILYELLTAQGAQVTQEVSAAGALAQLQGDAARESRFQVVLLDGTMPARGAFEVAECLMGRGPEMPRIVMMLATNDLTGEVANLRAAGVDNYIVKPVQRAELFAAVARARTPAQVEAHGDRFGPPAIASADAPSPFLNRPLQILMADDSQDNRALIRAYLKKTPYHLEEAEDGQEAIDKFVAGKFDLVLMDIEMPIVDGYEATSTIRIWEVANSRHRTPIVALTASALEEAVHRSKEAGCDAHVTKPVKKSTLLKAIRDAMEMSAVDGDAAAVANHKEETCRTG